MPPRPSPAFTIPDYHDRQAAHLKKWADLIKDDPRRVCRTLLLYTPRGETIEGDTFDDVAILFMELKKASNESTSQAWKALVDAGVISALCKYALNAEALIAMAYTTVNDDGAAEVMPQSLETLKENAPAPYTPALEVLCNAAVSCAIPATSTEHKMIDELKKNWSTIMQRLWSEPSMTLEPGGTSPVNPQLRVRERVVVAQLIRRLTLVDPTFLEVILKPSDLTLAVCFRYWLYSTADYDSVTNSFIFVPLVYDSDMSPDHWRRYFAKHPLPDMHTLLPRILLGASRGTEKKKRTPNQTAEFIVAAFANHFRRLKDRELDFALMFFTGMLNASKKEFPPFCRAVYRSADLWAALADIMIRHPDVHPDVPKQGTIPESFLIVVATLYMNVLHTPEAEAHVDELFYNWLAGGLLDALDAAHLTMIRSDRGAFVISNILLALDTRLPKLSKRTRLKLREELPRQRLMFTFIMMSTQKSLNRDALLTLARGDVEIHTTVPPEDPRHPVWFISAWQTLLRMTCVLRPFRGTCTRRGCEQPAYVGGCRQCDISAYCGQECMNRDRDEHKCLCYWMPTLTYAMLYNKRRPEELVRLRDGVVPADPPDHAPPSLEEILGMMRKEGKMSEEAIEQIRKISEKSQVDVTKAPVEPTSGVTEVEEAMEQLQLELTAGSST